jgi:hypothetical protein
MAASGGGAVPHSAGSVSIVVTQTLHRPPTWSILRSCAPPISWGSYCRWASAPAFLAAKEAMYDRGESSAGRIPEHRFGDGH